MPTPNTKGRRAESDPSIHFEIYKSNFKSGINFFYKKTRQSAYMKLLKNVTEWGGHTWLKENTIRGACAWGAVSTASVDIRR